LGIDPGLEGAVAVLDSENPSRITAADLPTTGSGTKRCIDELGLMRWLAPFDIDHAFIEYVSAMPGWGSGGSFRFGMAFGTLRAIIAMRGVPYTLVTPVKWKKFHSLPGGDKEAARQRALQLFPKSAELFARKKDHQRAEAALIATYGLQTQFGSGG
jgi:crossover junction endodeoxyribonuclease RuvC